MPTPKLYMILLGCKPKERLTEQHDMFFCISASLKALVPDLKQFWPQGEGNLHIDAWRTVEWVDGYKITVVENPIAQASSLGLFFINLGGYEKGHFDELHYKLLVVANSEGEAVKKAKTAEFYKTAGFSGARSHIDDQYDVDDLINVQEILPDGKYFLHFEQSNDAEQGFDEIHLGYFKLNKLGDG